MEAKDSKITLSGRKWYLNREEYEDGFWSANPKMKEEGTSKATGLIALEVRFI
ncbi:MAG: hypothetical protein MUP27_13675 [Desulfobacterales bacterium]|jgi:hypothetical protein|nr:hypothetical protein [Desulfobacterales bacterium]